MKKLKLRNVERVITDGIAEETRTPNPRSGIPRNENDQFLPTVPYEQIRRMF